MLLKKISQTIAFFTIFFFSFLLNYDYAFAADQKFITIVNPIRGKDFFQLSGKNPVDNFNNQLQIIKDKNLPATWLVRPDALEDKSVIEKLKTLSSNQEIGMFMEITPTWSKLANVNYRQSREWHFAGSALLTGYEVDERRKLIDSAFSKFKEIFGYYPKSVGAWWIDAGSLTYMYEKYKVLANMDVADQYTTDNYKVWGQYFSTPFYPAKKNALIPAQGEEDKIGVVTIQWAMRDPYNSYGNGVLDSTYSVQANDYANEKFHDLNIDYFKKLLSIYLDNPYSALGQVTVGIENDFSWDEFGLEYSKQIEEVSRLSKNGVKVVTMSEFASVYSKLFPQNSPSQIIFTKDPLEGQGTVLWYMTPRYRVGWFYNNKGSIVRDLRTYYNNKQESCLEKACSDLNLAMTEVRNIDEVTYGDHWDIDLGKISDIKISKITDGVRLEYLNQLNSKRIIEFLPNDIKVDGVPRPIPVVINQEIETSRTASKIEHNFSNSVYGDVKELLLDKTKGLIIFIFFAAIFFYLPGQLLLFKTNIGINERFILSWPIGICLFTLTAYGLGFFSFWEGLWVLPIISVLVVRQKFTLFKISFNRNFLLPFLIIILGSVTWLATTVKNGLIYNYGLGFWGPHGHDAIWHLSLIEQIKNGLPLSNPLFAGETLRNYHFFYDLLLSGFGTISGLSSVDLYFRFFPILLCLSLGLTVSILTKVWSKNNIAPFIALFFIYFGGSFGWVLTYIKDRNFGGETTFWAQQAISTLINPPFAISLLIFSAGLYIFYTILEQKKYQWTLMLPLIILWGSLVEFKVYIGILVLVSLCLVTFVEMAKRNLQILKISIPIVLLSLIVFLPNNLGSSSLLVFSPFWLIHSMIDFPDRLSFMRFSYSRIVNLETGNYIKLFAVELISLVIFIIGNLGTRFLGFLLPKRYWKFDTFNILILLLLLLSLILPILFIQKGANFNTIQFFYYFLFLFNFLTALSLSQLIQRFKVLGSVVLIVVVLLTVPTTLGTLNHYLPSRPPARISRAELDALNFLKDQPIGVVLSFFDKHANERFTEPKPLYVYESTSYISAFSSQPEYISDTVNLDILGFDYKGRLQIQKEVFEQKEISKIKEILQKEKINYIYAPRIANFSPDQIQAGIKSIYLNDEVTIYRVNRE